MPDARGKSTYMYSSARDLQARAPPKASAETKGVHSVLHRTSLHRAPEKTPKDVVSSIFLSGEASEPNANINRASQPEELPEHTLDSQTRHKNTD